MELSNSAQELTKLATTIERISSDIGVEAWFNAGLCYKKMGYNRKAVKVFQEIVKDHPASAFAKRARLQIDLLKILSQ